MYIIYLALGIWYVNLYELAIGERGRGREGERERGGEGERERGREGERERGREGERLNPK